MMIFKWTPDGMQRIEENRITIPEQAYVMWSDFVYLGARFHEAILVKEDLEKALRVTEEVSESRRQKINSINEARENSDETICQLVKHKERLLNQNARLEDSIQELEHSLMKANKLNEQYIERNAKLTIDLGRLSGELAEHEKIDGNSENKNADLQNIIKERDDTIQALTARIKELQKAFTTIQYTLTANHHLL